MWKMTEESHPIFEAVAAELEPVCEQTLEPRCAQCDGAGCQTCGSSGLARGAG